MKRTYTQKDHNPWYARGDGWTLAQDQWEPAKNLYFETILTQSNGYFGVRGFHEEITPGLAGHRESYLAGVFAQIDKVAVKQIRVNYPWPMLCMVSLPEIFACRIKLGGQVFRLDQGTIHSYRRYLSMKNGELTREVDWKSPAGIKCECGYFFNTGINRN